MLPGVTVEAASPVLIEKVRSAVTDASGQYRIIELRPGTYTVTYTLPGFTTLRREGIELSTNFTATLNIDLKVGAVAETVTVTGETPLIDVKGVTREQVISKAMMDALPTSKSMGGLIALVPGAVSPANGLDVGGSKGEQSVRISVHGARTGDMRQMVDGMLFSNLNSDGAGRLYFVNPITVQENVIDLGTAGSAQYQLGGAVINSIPRDGGNRFTATAFVAGTGHNLQSNNLTDELRAQQVTQVNGVRDIYDFSGLVGGPAVRDRLWWVVSARLNGSTTRSANQFHDVNLEDWKFTPDPSQPVDPEEQTRSNQFRMTWQASKKDKITGFFDIQKHFRQQAFGELDRGEAVIESGAAMCHNDSLTQFTWARPQSQKLLFEGGGTLGLNTFGRPSFGTQLDGSDYQRCGISEPLRVLVIDAPAGYTAGYHGFGSVGIGIANQFAGRFSTSVVTGSHTFKAGMNILEGLHQGQHVSQPAGRAGSPAPIRIHQRRALGLHRVHVAVHRSGSRPRPRAVRAGSMVARPPDGERRAALRLDHGARPDDRRARQRALSVLHGTGCRQRAQLEGSQPARWRCLGRRGRRQDRGQGRRQPLRHDTHDIGRVAVRSHRELLDGAKLDRHEQELLP